MADGNCDYEYFSDATNGIEYFKEVSSEPNNAAAAQYESFSGTGWTYASCVTLCLR
jgi:hypothetical protein